MDLHAALLVTDVVDSTSLAERLGDAEIARVWAAHDRIARDLLERHGGREIDKTDGFLLLFDDVGPAVAYAAAYHRAILEVEPPLRARAGIHFGSVVLTENSPDDVRRGAKPVEVDGLAKPTAARVMSVATGGQTLLTAEANARLEGQGIETRSHGFWRMKGRSEPVELIEVGHEHAPFTPPPDGAKVYRVVRNGELWLPAREIPHSLPAERDAFVGRTEDLHRLEQLLARGRRLVTVLGIGGTGKTRLVTRFGWTWLGDWPGGVWFCDLSEARAVDGIVSAVGRALDVSLGDADPVLQLGQALTQRGRCLVLLDNFEQVSQHADATLGRWLDRAPEATFVVTTRELLGLPGETALAIPPLPVDEGVALFAERAVQAKHDYVPDPSDLPVIRELVALLDGLPLAIELAAARVRVMPPRTIVARMSERFRLLAGPRRDRHGTLRAALDWSWDLLEPDEQAALAQLSVFEGGFSLEAAEAVLALETLWPTDAVQALVDKSLVRQVSHERIDPVRMDPVRMDLLVSVQAYAREHLDARGDAEPTEARHGQWAVGLRARQASAEGMRSLGAEVPNLTAALRRAIARDDGQLALDTLTIVIDVLRITGPLSAAVALAGEVVRMPLNDAQMARAERVLGIVHEIGGNREAARAHLERALELARKGGARNMEAAALGSLGILFTTLGHSAEAEATLLEAIGIYDEVGDRSGAALNRNNLATVYANLGRLDEARAAHEQALVAFRALGNRLADAYALAGLGVIHSMLGQTAVALGYHEQALEAHRDVRNLVGAVAELLNVGVTSASLGQTARARACMEEGIATAREVGDRRWEGIGLSQLAGLEIEEGHLEVASAHLEEALAALRETGDRRNEVHVFIHQGGIHARNGEVAAARERYAEALERAVEIQSPLEQAQVQMRLARLELDRDPYLALSHLERAEPVAAELHAAHMLTEIGALRAEALHRSGDRAAAEAALVLAETSAPEGHVGARRALARARAALS